MCNGASLVSPAIATAENAGFRLVAVWRDSSLFSRSTTLVMIYSEHIVARPARGGCSRASLSNHRSAAPPGYDATMNDGVSSRLHACCAVRWPLSEAADIQSLLSGLTRGAAMTRLHCYARPGGASRSLSASSPTAATRGCQDAGPGRENGPMGHRDRQAIPSASLRRLAHAVDRRAHAGWISRIRRLSRDYERLTRIAAAARHQS